MKSRASVITFVLFASELFLNAETASALEWRIPLTPAPQYLSAKGKAKYKDRGGEREFQVEVENLRALRVRARISKSTAHSSVG